MKDSELCQLSIQHWERMIDKLKWIMESNLNIDLRDRDKMGFILGESHYGDYCSLCKKYVHVYGNCNNCPINIFSVRCGRYNSVWSIVDGNKDQLEKFIEVAEKYMIPMLYKMEQICIMYLENFIEGNRIIMKIIEKISNCGCEYRELNIDGQYVLGGDEYHEKIGKKIEGFIEALKFLKIKYLYKKGKIKCPYCN